MTRIILTLCEGPHDVAFLYRILKTEGYQSFNKKLQEFPTPIADLLIEEVKLADVEELKIDQVKNRLLPREVLHKTDTYILFYAIGGDSKAELRKSLVDSIYALIPQNENEISPLSDDTDLSVIYFFDADNQGVEARIKQINSEIISVLGDIADPFENNGEKKKIKGLNLGGFVFSTNEGKGKLEDILIPMMKESNEKIFEDAAIFLENADPERQKELKLIDEDGTLKETRGKKVKYDIQKSLVGVVGQLQRSGSSNVVAIRFTDYVSLDKIRKDQNCSQIITFFKLFEQ
ncbi:MAG TPA: hypothetical protein DCE41_02910 [Cytophagales bacterium]|nr:hypothetical protein [Cytophagales bacterium]HAP59660.1 hypothetical protein [Cytophagales bacterium]